MTTRKPPTQRPAMPQNGVRDKPEESQEDFDASIAILEREIEEGERELKAIKARLQADGLRLAFNLCSILGLLLLIAWFVSVGAAVFASVGVVVMWVLQYVVLRLKRCYNGPENGSTN